MLRKWRLCLACEMLKCLNLIGFYYRILSIRFLGVTMTQNYNEGPIWIYWVFLVFTVWWNVLFSPLLKPLLETTGSWLLLMWKPLDGHQVKSSSERTISPLLGAVGGAGRHLTSESNQRKTNSQDLEIIAFKLLPSYRFQEILPTLQLSQSIALSKLCLSHYSNASTC